MDLLLFLSFCLLSYRGALGQLDLIANQTVEVKYGNDATIPCKLSRDEYSNQTMKWLYVKNGRHIIYPSGPEGDSFEVSELKKRVSVVHNFVLVISKTSVQDEAVFICEMETSSGVSLEYSVKLLVYKAPEHPEIKLKQDSILVTNDTTEIAECSSKNGYPSPTITWYKNNTPLRNGENNVIVRSQMIKESSGLVSVSSSLSMPVQQSDSDAFFHCEVSYQLLENIHMMESEKANFTTQYVNKKLILFKKTPTGPVKEGDTVELRCQGDGNPQPEITFNKVDQEDKTYDGSTLILENVKREASGGYYCLGFDINSDDPNIELRADIELHVHFLDTPSLSQESPAIAELGSDFSILCKANGSAKINFQWKKDDTVIANDPSLDLKNVDYNMSGMYMCVAELLDVPGLSVHKELQIIVKGKPEVSVSPGFLQVQNGDEVNVMCRAQGYPKPRISWSDSGNAENEEEDDYGVTSNRTVLVTFDLIRWGINCTAVNSFGTDMKIILLEEIPDIITSTLISTGTVPETTTSTDINADEQTKEGSHGVVIVAVIVCILLLAILGAVLYFLYKKGRIPCGRSGKQDITTPGEKDKIVVEMKPDSPAEESVLLPGPQEKKPPGDQGEKYMDLRN
ncbi:cell surface glycoprotein MUC18 isoform X2 [Bombina bombina]|uniref:cell surface glycoprotein MUC18 isoform X2 n=1 Tax=Bombina bombina TaxID=8345 RepID=UPI00235AB5BF|nr:cell surface glycoprotein MUC18 isoform X2 [Bombina bombina]